jgi:putative effector of murein hydrolase
LKWFWVYISALRLYILTKVSTVFLCPLSINLYMTNVHICKHKQNNPLTIILLTEATGILLIINKEDYITYAYLKGKVKFTLQQVMKAQMESRGIALLFLQP